MSRLMKLLWNLLEYAWAMQESIAFPQENILPTYYV